MKTQFIENKVVELLNAAKNCKKSTEKEISEYTSLGNNLKKCYLKVGILKEAGKQGRIKLYGFNVFKINVDTVTEAYRYKESLENPSKVTTTVVNVSKPVVNVVKTTKEHKELFPSVEDCKKYLQHLYGANAEVVITITIK